MSGCIPIFNEVNRERIVRFDNHSEESFSLRKNTSSKNPTNLSFHDGDGARKFTEAKNKGSPLISSSTTTSRSIVPRRNSTIAVKLDPLRRRRVPFQKGNSKNQRMIVIWTSFLLLFEILDHPLMEILTVEKGEQMTLVSAKIA